MPGHEALRALYGHAAVVCLEGENGLMLCAVVLVDAANVVPKRNTPDKAEEENDADHTIDYVEENLISEYGKMILEQCGHAQWKQLIEGDKECQREKNVQGRGPCADFGFSLAAFLIFRGLCTFCVCFFGLCALLHDRLFCVFASLGIFLFQSNIGGKAQCSEAERHGVSQGCYPANDRPPHPFVMVRRAGQRLGVEFDLALRLAFGGTTTDGDSPGMR